MDKADSKGGSFVFFMILVATAVKGERRGVQLVAFIALVCNLTKSDTLDL